MTQKLPIFSGQEARFTRQNICVFLFILPQNSASKICHSHRYLSTVEKQAVFVLYVSNRGGPPLHKGFMPLLFPLSSSLSCPHLHGLGKPSSLNCHLCMSPHSKSVYLEGRVGTRWGTGPPLTDSCTCCQTGSGEAHTLGPEREQFKLSL